MIYDRWIGNDPKAGCEEAVMWIKNLARIPFPMWREHYSVAVGFFREFEWGNIRIDFHKMKRPDSDDCYHNHLAHAVRCVVKGGYIEEVFEPGRCCGDGPVEETCCGFPEKPRKIYERRCGPGHISIVRPGLIHRVKFLLDGPSYSFWLRGPITHRLKLYGEGYKRLLGPEGIFSIDPDDGGITPWSAGKPNEN